MHNFVQCHKDVALDVLTVPGKCLVFHPIPACSAEATVRAASTAEELFEKIAETGAVEMKFSAIIRTSSKSACLLFRLMVGTVPVFSQLVILPPLIRVAENLVGLVDFLESAFGTRFVFGDIGVIFACQFPKCLLDFSVARVLGHTENIVVIFELNGHDWSHCRGRQGGSGSLSPAFFLFQHPECNTLRQAHRQYAWRL